MDILRIMFHYLFIIICTTMANYIANNYENNVRNYYPFGKCQYYMSYFMAIEDFPLQYYLNSL